jgi:predicted DNA-binding transcriptional regulator AlpA
MRARRRRPGGLRRFSTGTTPKSVAASLRLAELPTAIKLGHNVVRWKASEIQQLIDALPKAG